MRRIPMFSIHEKVLTCMFQSTLRSCQRLRKRNVCLLQSRPHKKAKNRSSTWRRAKHRWREKVPKVPLEIFSNLNFRMLLMNSPTLLSQTHWLLKQRKDQMRRRNSVFCRMRVSTKDDVFCKHILHFQRQKVLILKKNCRRFRRVVITRIHNGWPSDELSRKLWGCFARQKNVSP